MGFLPLRRRHRPLSAARTSSAPAPHQRAQLGLGWVPQERDIFPSLHRRGEPDGRGAAGPLGPRRGLRAVSAVAGAARQHGQPAFGRRAADADDRPHADDQPGRAAARRAARGPGADHRRGTHRRDPQDGGARTAWRSCWSSSMPRWRLQLTEEAVDHRTRRHRASRQGRGTCLPTAKRSNAMSE